MTDVLTQSLHEVAALLKSGQLSPVELLELTLARIDRHDPGIHAFVTVTREHALAAARQAEQEIQQGNYRGPLHGIPVGLKDNIATQGIRTTANSLSLRDWIPEKDADVYQALTRAGAVLVGKQNLWEFAGGVPSLESRFPPVANPWNTAYSPGGSSSGSAAAVAAGFCFASIGTDTGGSIRYPAAACGVVGMKPTYGQLSCEGIIPLSQRLDHAGPITRYVKDNAIVLSALNHRLFPFQEEDWRPDASDEAPSQKKPIVLGIPAEYMQTVPHSPECLANFRRAMSALEDRGFSVVEISAPQLLAASALAARITLMEGYAYHQQALEQNPDQFQTSFRSRMLLAAQMSPADQAEIESAYRALVAGRMTLFETLDAIMFPTIPDVADALSDVLGQGYAPPANATRMYNTLGLPALSVPMGFGQHGLPLALQIAGRPHAENFLYKLAGMVEASFAAEHPRWPCHD